MDKKTRALLRRVAETVIEWADGCDRIEHAEAVYAEETPEKLARCLRENVQSGFPHESLRRWGCYFFALLRWSQEFGANLGLDDNAIVRLFDSCRGETMPNPTPGDGRGARIPIITERAFVNDPVRVLNRLVGESVANRVAVWTNEPDAREPLFPVFVPRVKHPARGAHFVLSVGGRIWDSLLLDGRRPAGFRALG